MDETGGRATGVAEHHQKLRGGFLGLPKDIPKEPEVVLTPIIDMELKGILKVETLEYTLGLILAS